MIRRLKHIVKYLIDERYRTKILLISLNRQWRDKLKLSAKMRKEYIKKQYQHLQLLGSNIKPLRPGVGFYTTVDGLEISKDYFPEEYEQILKAWDSVATKIKELNQNKDE